MSQVVTARNINGTATYLIDIFADRKTLNVFFIWTKESCHLKGIVL